MARVKMVTTRVPKGQEAGWKSSGWRGLAENSSDDGGVVVLGKPVTDEEAALYEGMNGYEIEEV